MDELQEALGFFGIVPEHIETPNHQSVIVHTADFSVTISKGHAHYVASVWTRGSGCIRAKTARSALLFALAEYYGAT